MRSHALHYLYTKWLGMWDRCVNSKNVHYHRYGGRGINVCDSWRDFEVFLTDMGVPKDRRLSLDRIDNDGGYEPGNCRWATMKQQRANQTPWGTTTGRFGPPKRLFLQRKRDPRQATELPDDWLDGLMPK